MTNAELALETITSADLSPTEHLILKHFIESAVDPEAAAQYLFGRTRDTTDSVGNSLRNFKRQWRRLASRLLVFDRIPQHVRDLAFERDGRDFAFRVHPSHVPGSNVEPAYVIPPSMIAGLDPAKDGTLLDMLDAFLTSSRVNYLHTLLENETQDDATSLRNVLLLPPSIHNAFRAGHVDISLRSARPTDWSSAWQDEYLDKCGYEMWKQYPEEPTGLFLGDHTPFRNTLQPFDLSTSNIKGLPLPSNFLIDVHYRFATALHLFSIEDKVNRGWARPSICPPLFGPVSHAFKSLWLCVPQWLRVSCYNLLAKIGRTLYPLEVNVWSQRLPFGLYMKKCIRAPKNEPNVLKLIEERTTIPAPRLIDTWENENEGVTHILMTRLPGVPIGDVRHLMSYKERDRFADDVRACVEQLRKIPNSAPYLICDSLGGQIADHRLPGNKGGPFKTEDDFNNYLTSPLGEPFSEFIERKNLPVRKHTRFFFTHSDLHHSNLLVENGQLSGIVDWESAGFRPEYWEFTKAMYGTTGPGIMRDIWWRAFGRQYEPELEVEQQLWYSTPFGF
ncbi:kinase-like domain-containing protein [Aspergillus pseudodeflectus]|uniref:Kinase-like domain-containing protein n=1 Tax=Aspergillus pseudodeflectus TaxID=176178 RepID=A0ABR4KWX2_9EURO